MRLESALYSSKEGITAHGQAISVVGDNIANANTAGFKISRVQFADLLPDGRGGDDPAVWPSSGNGVRISSVRPIHESGILELTGRDLDLGIDGNGFFIVGDTTSQLYSRAGNLEIDSEGFLVQQSGERVLGYAGTGTTLGSINMRNFSTSGKPTSAVSIFGNLDSSAPLTTVPANPATFNVIAQAASHVTGVTVYDSLGASHDVTLAFYRTANNSWTIQAYLDGSDVGGVKGAPVKIGEDVALPFGSDGAIPEASKAAAVLTATPPYGGGAAAGNFKMTLSGFTQFASFSELKGITQDGQGVGSVATYEFTKDGIINAILDNGSRSQVGRVLLADVTNISGLERAGDGLYAAGVNAGTIEPVTPGTRGLGTLQGGSLELSNVDISDEFVDLVLYQRAYQASSQTLNAANTLIKDTISLIR